MKAKWMGIGVLALVLALVGSLWWQGVQGPEEPRSKGPVLTADPQQALEAAHREGRPVFLEFYGDT